jgi:amino acid transporter
MSQEQNQLRKNSLSLISVAGMAAVLMSPALGLYFNWGGMALNVGIVGPLVYLVAMIATLPTAYTYSSVAREISSAGQAYTWLWRAIGPKMGFWTGIVLSLFYMTTIWLVAIMFSLFFHDFLAFFGVHLNEFGDILGILIALGFAGWVSYRDIQFNSKVTMGFLLFETLIVLLLGVIIFVVQLYRGHATLAPFNPANATGGFSGFRTALIFGVLSFIGFDYAAVLAEEAKTPKKSVPIAVILSVVLVGLFWIVGSYFFSISVPMKDVGKYVNSGFTPITPIAHLYLGFGNLIIIITGMTAALGNLSVAVPAAARVLYAMGRDGILPKRLGIVHPRYQVPWNALHVVLTIGIISTIIMGVLQGNFFNAYIWFGTVSAMLALSVYIVVAIASGLFFWRFARQKFSMLKHGILPFIALVVNAYLLWGSFLQPLWGQPFATGRSMVLFCILVWIAAVIYTALISKTRPSLLHQQASSLVNNESDITVEG